MVAILHLRVEGAGDDIVTSDLGPDGSASVENKFVMNVEYQLTETEAPKGYLPAEDIFFKLPETVNFQRLMEVNH